MPKEMKYFVINLMTGQKWEGIAKNANEAYSHLKINKGDTTVVQYGRLSNVREW